MNETAFVEIISTALNHPDQQIRIRQTQIYFDLLKNEPLQYLQLVLQVFQNAELVSIHDQLAILLRKNVTQTYNNCAFVRGQNPELNQLIILTLLNLIAQHNASTLILSDCVAEIVNVLFDKQDLVFVLDFVEQALGQQNLQVQVAATKILSTILGSSVSALDNFGLKRLLTLLECTVNIENFDVSEYAVQGVCNILMASQYAQYSSTSTFSLTNEIKQQLQDALIQKLCTMASVQFTHQQKQKFIKALEHFQDLMEMALDLFYDHIPTVFQLIQALIQTSYNDDQLFKKGMAMLEALCDTNTDGVDVSQDYYPQIIEMLIGPVYSAIQYDSAYIQDLMQKEDPSQLQVDNSLHSFLFQSLTRIFSVKLKQLAIPSLNQYIAQNENNQSLEYHYSIVFLLQILINSESYDIDDSKNYITGKLLPYIQYQNPYVIYLMLLSSCKLISYVGDSANNHKFVIQYANTLILQVNNLLTNPYVFIQGAVLQFFSTLLDILNTNESLQFYEASAMLINGFESSDSTLVQFNRVKLIKVIVQQMPKNLIYQLIVRQIPIMKNYFICSFNELSIQMDNVKHQFLSQVIETLTIFITQYPEQFGEEIPKFIQYYMQLITSPICGELHQLMDALMDSLIRFTDNLGEFLSPYIDVIMPVLFRITDTPLFELNYSLTGKEDVVNKHIVQQHKTVFKAYAQLVKTCPKEMYRYFEVIYNKYESLNLFKFYDFIFQVDVICLIPAIMFKNGDQAFPNVLQRAVKILDMAILPDGDKQPPRRCCEEAKAICSALIDLLPVMSNSVDDLMKLITYLKYLYTTSNQSHKQYVANLQSENISSEECQHFLTDSRLEIQTTADVGNQLVMKILRINSDKIIIQGLVEISSLVFSKDGSVPYGIGICTQILLYTPFGEQLIKQKFLEVKVNQFSKGIFYKQDYEFCVASIRSYPHLEPVVSFSQLLLENIRLRSESNINPADMNLALNIAIAQQNVELVTNISNLVLQHDAYSPSLFETIIADLRRGEKQSFFVKQECREQIVAIMFNCTFRFDTYSKNRTITDEIAKYQAFCRSEILVNLCDDLVKIHFGWSGGTQ